MVPTMNDQHQVMWNTSMMPYPETHIAALYKPDAGIKSGCYMHSRTTVDSGLQQYRSIALLHLVYQLLTIVR